MTGRQFQLAVVTGRHAPELSEDGKRVAAALAEDGIESTPVMWDDTSVDWQEYDGVLVRSCWEYPENRSRFRALLGELEAAEVPVCNPLRVLRWNLHKQYLTALADAGVRIPPTTVVEQGADTSLEAVVRTQGWQDVVIKPAIGAMSSQVRRTTASELADSERAFAELVADHDVLVQKFVPEIAAGERSIVFFGGGFSHAWNSLTTPDDITSFDGVDAEYDPPSEIRTQAKTALETACDIVGIDPSSLPYARVDYVHCESELLLMELELIEPYLGLDRGEHAVEQFREALVSYFGGQTGDDWQA